jgi:anti-sigma B factor antagonist
MITVEAIAPDRLRATVADEAPAFDPLARPEIDISLPLEARAIGGLGVHLVKKLMDLCSYERRNGKNLFTIERKLNRAPSAAPSMSITASKLESSATLALTGRLDGLSSSELEPHVRALIASGIRTLVFDLAALEYVSSAGLRIFIVAAKAMKAAGGQAHFISLTPNVREVFHVSGLLTALSVQESRDAMPPA